MRALSLALVAALLFGASTPASKFLLADLSPLQLAGLLYLGAALATAPLALRERRLGRTRRVDTPSLRRLGIAIVLGGMLAPVLVLVALRIATSGSVALLLNLEMLFTVVLGVLWFREHLGRIGWIGVAAGLVAGALLSADAGPPGLKAGLLVAAACAAWGIDNHVTALIDGMSPAETTMWKGLAAGTTNLVLGLALEEMSASAQVVMLALLVGMFSYGISIVLYVLAAQHLGATRAQVAFATAPFLGAGLSIVWLGEPWGSSHVAAGVGFTAGVALLLLDRHEHEHVHRACEHVHSHRHYDGHHDHSHPGLSPSTRHTHTHVHAPLTHAHRHLPDLHHRHDHGPRRRPK